MCVCVSGSQICDAKINSRVVIVSGPIRQIKTMEIKLCAMKRKRNKNKKVKNNNDKTQQEESH